MCSFCYEEDDYQAKIWYYRKRGKKLQQQELLSDVNYPNKEHKMCISPSHVLSLNNFETNDSGVYVCKSFTDNEDLFTYVLDETFDAVSLPKVGSTKDWHEFYWSIIKPTNQYINGAEFMTFPFEVEFVWDVWGPCERQNYQNFRNKTGKCRIYPKRQQIIEIHSAKKTNLNDEAIMFLLDDFNISCRSVQFNKFYPKLSKIVRIIPEFIIKEPCSQINTLVVKSGNNFERQNNRTKNALKNQNIKYVSENGHLTLSCPEVLESEVKWYKDNTPLNSSFKNNMANSREEPHLTIDTYNTLYILHASKSQEGIYTCTVNGKYIESFHVKVVTQSKFLNQDFIRYSIYLGFVLSLTVICYCAGICVAWQRRASFADPFYLMTKQRSNAFGDCENLLKK